MKLAAIYIVWDDWDLLFLSYQAIKHSVDLTIIIYSDKSNTGEYSNPPFELMDIYGVTVGLFEPDPTKT